MATRMTKRLETLESKVRTRKARGALPWSERAPWKTIIERWRGSRKDGLELDMNSGRLMTFEELQQADPERAEALAERRRLAAETLTAFEGDKVTR
jgi:hypothetical protein